MKTYLKLLDLLVIECPVLILIENPENAIQSFFDFWNEIPILRIPDRIQRIEKRLWKLVHQVLDILPRLCRIFEMSGEILSCLGLFIAFISIIIVDVYFIFGWGKGGKGGRNQPLNSKEDRQPLRSRPGSRRPPWKAPLPPPRPSLPIPGPVSLSCRACFR